MALKKGFENSQEKGLENSQEKGLLACGLSYSNNFCVHKETWCNNQEK